MLHNTSCKDNKSKIIDCCTVSECFCKHQSCLRWIKGTAPNAYDAEQTEMDSLQQANYIVALAAGKVNSINGFINFIFKWTLQLTNKVWTNSLDVLVKNLIPFLIWVISTLHWRTKRGRTFCYFMFFKNTFWKVCRAFCLRYLTYFRT